MKTARNAATRPKMTRRVTTTVLPSVREEERRCHDVVPMPFVLLTGATRGIGRAAAIELARRGAELALVGRDGERGRAAGGRGGGGGGGAAGARLRRRAGPRARRRPGQHGRRARARGRRAAALRAH